MIPVLIVAILNRCDLLERMLASVDDEVAHLVVIDNGDVTRRWKSAIPHTTVLTPGANLGVSASWNLGLKTTPDAAWWLIANHDVEFQPGSLGQVVQFMEAGGDIGMMSEFAAFTLSAETVARVGLFDENFVPAYCEDADFRYRARISGLLAEHVGRAAHRISSTIVDSPRFARANSRTYPANVEYYRSKWGGVMGCEVYRTPFDRGGPISEWSLNWRRLVEQSRPWMEAAEVTVLTHGGETR